MANSVAKQAKSSASERILGSAETLFTTHGYAATTNEMIAVEAGVALQTVYFSFRSKPNILRGLVESRVDGELSALEASVRRVHGKPADNGDADSGLVSHVKACAAVNARVGCLLDMLRRAADADPTATELWQRHSQRWRAIQRTFVARLRDGGFLASNVRPQRAIDICTVLLGPESFCSFVTVRRWPQREWERWTTRLLSRELIATE